PPCLLPHRLPPPPPLFPYTTLFRSQARLPPPPMRRERAPSGEVDDRPRQQDPGHAADRHRPEHRLRERRDLAPRRRGDRIAAERSEEHTSELQSRENLVCRLLLEKK